MMNELRIGDVVVNDVWEDTRERFRVCKIHGNQYCTIVALCSTERNKKINGFPQFLRIVDSGNRPFKRLELAVLLKMAKNPKCKNEIVRELNMRKNVR